MLRDNGKNKKQDCHAGIQYHLAPNSENCKPEKIVDSVEECINASIELNIAYRGLLTNSKRPAGCYKFAYEFAYFNSILNPNLTIPSGPRRGICRCPGRFS